jgi:hypothetical protein
LGPERLGVGSDLSARDSLRRSRRAGPRCGCESIGRGACGGDRSRVRRVALARHARGTLRLGFRRRDLRLRGGCAGHAEVGGSA